MPEQSIIWGRFRNALTQVWQWSLESNNSSLSNLASTESASSSAQDRLVGQNNLDRFQFDLEQPITWSQCQQLLEQLSLVPANFKVSWADNQPITNRIAAQIVLQLWTSTSDL